MFLNRCFPSILLIEFKTMMILIYPSITLLLSPMLQSGKIEDIERRSFFLGGELKNCIGGGFGRVYMNSSNLIYVDIIFLKLKIY